MKQEPTVRFKKFIKECPETNCWVWQGVTRAGYGLFYQNGRMKNAHYFSFTVLKQQTIPIDHIIRHTCDNPLCVNPDHLISGTRKENMQDASARGRTTKGERHRTVTKPESTPSGKQNRSKQICDLDRERFLKKVEKTDTCWLWKAAFAVTGYGVFGLLGKITYAHRASYLLFKGEIPEGLVVRHTCNNRTCVNPEHLILGTHEENMSDMRAAGSSEKKLAAAKRMSGSNNGNAKLTEEIVTKIISLLSTKSNVELAKMFATFPSSIRQIRLGISWRYLPRP